MKIQRRQCWHDSVIYSVPHSCNYILIILNVIYELKKSVKNRIQDLTEKTQITLKV